MPPKAAYEAWLDDPDIRRWFDNNARGSVVTAREHARILFRDCKRRNITPWALVALNGL